VEVRCRVCDERTGGTAAPLLADLELVADPQDVDHGVWRCVRSERTGRRDGSGRHQLLGRGDLRPISGTGRVVALQCRRCRNAPRIKGRNLAALAAAARPGTEVLL